MSLNVGVLKLAIEEAESSHYFPFRIGAVIFKGSRIFSSGHNDVRASQIPNKYKKFINSLHAEQMAILNAPDWEKLKGASILVIRMNASGNLRLGFPCEMCMKFIHHIGIKKIFYSNEDGSITLKRV